MMRTDRIQVDYILDFVAPFHCGTGVRTGVIDRSVMRDGNGYLYVPGSTIKGVLRELCEQIERFYEDSDDAMRARIASPHDKEIALRDLRARPTLVTRIFGSQIRPGLLYFNDAQQPSEYKKLYGTRDEPGRYQEMQTDPYTQVRIHRLTRTAERGALYNSEFGVRNMTFHGSIIGGLECIPISSDIHETFSASDHEPTYSLLLLLAGLHMIERIGGNKSTGKGECRCTITHLHINQTTFPSTDTEGTPAKQWETWLQHLDALSYYSLMAQEEEE